MKNSTYGETIRKIRVAKGISQEAMAFKLGISQATYYRIESGATTPDYYQVYEISKHLEIPMPEAPLAEKASNEIQVPQEQKPAHAEKKFLGTIVGKIVLLGSGILIINAVYDFIHGFCASWGLTKSATDFIALPVGMMIIILMFYLARRSERIG